MDIESILNTKSAIRVNNVTEYNFITALIKKHGGRSLGPYKEQPYFALGMENIFRNSNCYTDSILWYEQNGYEVYQASQFMDVVINQFPIY